MFALLRRVRAFLEKKHWVNSWLSLFFDALSIRLIVYGGLHEKNVSELLKRLKGDIFVDVGAYFGYYSLLLRKNFREIYAFEPFPENFRKVCDNLRRFRAGNVVSVMNAVSDFDGKAFLWLTEYGKYPQLVSEKQLVHESLLNHLKMRKIVSLLPVEVVTLSQYFPSSKLDLVKVDVEGAEWEVLKGAEPILSRIKRWVVELHDPKRKREIEEWFTSHGYSFRWIDFQGKTGNHIYAWREMA